MIAKWAFQAYTMGLRFPTNHHSTIRDGMHREARESASQYVAKKGDGKNVGERCFEGRDRWMEGNCQRPQSGSCYRGGKLGHMQWECMEPRDGRRNPDAGTKLWHSENNPRRKPQEERGLPKRGEGTIDGRRKGAARVAQWLQGDDESGLETEQGAREDYLSNDTSAWSEVSWQIERMAGGRKGRKGEGSR